MNRGLNFTVMVSSLVLMYCGQLDAAVINLTKGSTSGYVLTNGNTYVVQESVSFSNTKSGGSGMSVEDGATVVLYIPTGVVLTATGANGNGKTGGGAGICVPSNAILVVTGEGAIEATGGNAGNGGRGLDGSNGDHGGSYYQGGISGAGGAGGGGAGAAIGGVGGTGGAGGEGVVYWVSNGGWTSNPDGSNDGMNGVDGETSGTMGRVFVLGRISMQNSGGGAGAGGKAGATATYVYRISVGTPYQSGDRRNIGGGGGGGGGGAGAAPKCPIGAGGASGGGGGGGGSGAVATSAQNLETHGGGGLGGLSQVAPGASGDANSDYGGEGGAGGGSGVEGGAGELYVSSVAIVDVDRTRLSAETHSAAQYVMTFDANGGAFVSESNAVVATLGCALPDCLPTPIRQGYLLRSWKDDNGMEYYGGDGCKKLSSYPLPVDVALHAEWIDDPDAVTITPASGTVFNDSLTISMSCTVDGATIYYTTDGSEPTTESEVYQKKFRIFGKTTFKAFAVSDVWTNRRIVVSSYAKGQCPDPVISSSCGESFVHGQAQVSIDWDCSDGVLRYTTDGSDVTATSPVYAEAFMISETTTVKAKAFGETYFDSQQVALTVTREWEKVAAPEITAAKIFTGAKNRVEITCSTDGATIYYTLDGSEPTARSALFSDPLYVTESCTIKAIAVKDDYLDSDVETQSVARVWVPAATPAIVTSTTFAGTKNKVVISSATDQAVIYYTTDGSEPTAQSTRYEKPFCVTESCTVKAIAVREEFLDSDVASVNMSRTWSIGRTMGKSDHVFVTSGDEGFVRVDDATAVLGESMRSGTVKNSQTSILSTVVVGPGELSFKWKTSCEEDYPLHEWDHAEFVVDGETVDMLDGATEWKTIVHQISTDGDHQIEWRYVKDASESEGDDCMWVSEYSWQSDYTETQTTEDPVPYSWLTDKCCEVVDEYDSYENVAKQLSLNGRLTVEQCYVAGVDPESATNDFRAIIKMVYGVPKITWDPDLKGLREYQIWGKTTLDDSSAWQYPTNALHRFFKVMVEMP